MASVVVVFAIVVVIVFIYLFLGSSEDPERGGKILLRKSDSIGSRKLTLSSCWISVKGFSNSKFKTTSSLIRPSPFRWYRRLLFGHPLLCHCLIVRLSSKDGASRRLDNRRHWAAAMAIDAGGGVPALYHRSPWNRILRLFPRIFHAISVASSTLWVKIGARSLQKFDLSWLSMWGPLQTGSARPSTFSVIFNGLSGRQDLCQFLCSCPPCAGLQVSESTFLGQLKIGWWKGSKK